MIYVDGDIIDGASKIIPLIGQKTAGGETLVKAIAEAREDPAIGAIILRIDSPGGSALASELIAREVFATRGVKPILCSMSNLAASGGYFVAAGCELIFAEPMTITGSIGIFFGKFDLSGSSRGSASPSIRSSAASAATPRACSARTPTRSASRCSTSCATRTAGSSARSPKVAG